MRAGIRNSTASLVAMLAIDILVVLILSLGFLNRDQGDLGTFLQFGSGRIESTLGQAYLGIELAEAVVESGYDTLSDDELEILLDPIARQPEVRNISFLPHGIVEHVFPREGNESAIGDNIFEMPERKKEAEIALETREPVLSGPYELTQGGSGLILRKAVFLPDENGTEEFWGMVSLVMDTRSVLETIDLETVDMLGCEYELSATVNGGEKTLMEASGNYTGRGAVSVKIPLANGFWQLDIEKRPDSLEGAIVLTVFLSGLLMSIMRFRYLRRKEDELDRARNEAFVDNLTGLGNRSKLKEFESLTAEGSGSYTIFYLDLDNFKNINDTYGHDAGDRLLISVADRIRSMIRSDDLAIRLGGDELAIVLRGVSGENGIRAFCSKLESLNSERVDIGQTELPIALSFGYATFPTEGSSFEEVLQLADSRMYEQKRS